MRQSDSQPMKTTVFIVFTISREIDVLASTKSSKVVRIDYEIGWLFLTIELLINNDNNE